MISRKILFILFILISFLIPSVFAEELSQGACCYVPDSNEGIVEYLNFNSCPSPNQIYLGKPDNEDPTDFCKKYRDTRLGCITASGDCTAYAAGNAIYDLPQVLNFFDFDDYCTVLVPFSATCQGNQITTTGGTSTGTGTGSGSGSGTGDPYNGTFENTSTSGELIRLCADAGGPLGFFASKNSCEAFTIAGDPACIFNPYLGGHLNSELRTKGVSTIDSFEAACIPRSEVRQCFDYKTEANCVANPSAQYSSELSQGCAWIDTASYSETYFGDQYGMCISTSISDDSYLVASEYPFRMNHFSNPSFEQGVSGWSGAVSSNVVSNRIGTYHGERSYLLSSAIFQEVNHVDPRVGYSFSLYANSEQSSDTITVTFTSLDDTSSVVGSPITRTLSVQDYFSSLTYGSFQKVSAPTFVPDPQAQSVRIEIESNSVIEIDAVSFEPALRESVSVSDAIFKPVEVVPSSASRCELCRDELNLNSCTSSKSDTLGDCSYMVENPSSAYSSPLSNYLGNQDNLLANRFPWESQSLSNAQVFCEMYIDENTCIDPSNYVNSKFSSLHPDSGSTLCKWDTGIGGCFKDSDNNDYPDTRESLVGLYSYPDFSTLSFEYNYESDSTLGVPSDFALACDTLPPNGYIYFTASNTTGDFVLIEPGDVTSDMIGNLNIHVEASDTRLEACAPYSITPTLYIDYEVNGNAGFRLANSNQLKESYLAEDYFVDGNGTYFVNGVNNLSMRILDQSGNIGKTWDFSFDVDGQAPEIQLVSHTPAPNGFIGVLGPSTDFIFSLTDYSEIASCTYSLIPNTNSIPATFYTPSGQFDLDNMTGDQYTFTLPIVETSSNGDYYVLNIDCSDIFGQITSESYVFAVDYFTQVLVLEPSQYVSYNQDSGFYNRSTSLVAVSSDNDLISCSLSFLSGDFTGTTSLTLVENSSGFTLPDYSAETFYYTITGAIDFSSDGFKQGTLECSDSIGNVHSQAVEYYFDSEAPQLTSPITLQGPELSGIKSVVEINGTYYVRSNANLQLNTSVDGTGSWMKDSLEMWVDDNGTTYYASPFVTYNISDSTFIASSTIRSFEFPRLVYLGDRVESEQGKLYELNYYLSFVDRAGNPLTQQFNYYFDDTLPSFNFTGDIISQDADRIHSNVEDPQITIHFNTPSYRTYTCDVVGSRGPDSFAITLPASQELSFKPSDVSSFLVLTEEESLTFEFICTDIFGVSLSKSYELFYDNTVPVLNDIFLSSGDKKFYRNYENAIYPDYVDDVVFDLEDTSEKEFTCRYRVISAEPVYSCNSTYSKAIFTSAGLKKASDVTLLSRTASPDALCVRTDEFYARQQQSILQDEEFVTSLVVEGFCQDKVNYNTTTHYEVIDISYIRGDLTDFEINYDNGFALPFIRSIVEYPAIRISLSQDGSSPLLILTNAQSVGDYFEYAASSGFPLADLTEGEYDVYAVVLDDDSSVLQYVSTTLLVDKQAPTLQITVPDELNGTVYNNRFEVLFSAHKEPGAQLDRVEVYLNTTLLLTSENISEFNSNFVEPIDESQFYFDANKSNYYGRFIFNGSLDSNNTFVVVAHDEGGNSNGTVKTIQIKSGIEVILEDSFNAFVDPTEFSWVTGVSAPTINFRTSRVVDLCTVYPLRDPEFVVRDSNNEQVSFESSGTNQFSFDLSTLSQFDLSSLSDNEVTMQILCLFNNTRYQFNRSLSLVDQIPDYVLTSSEGFVLNEEPYLTNLSVTSVGPYRYVTCEYGIDSSPSIQLGDGVGTSFTQSVDFSSYSSGTYDLNLECRDVVGNVGYEKSYTFDIRKTEALQIFNATLSSALDTFIPREGVMYIAQSDNLDLTLQLNKRQDVSCSYIINTNTVFSGPVNFFRNLFSVGSQDLVPGVEPYSFTAQGLDFDRDNSNTLRVDCTNGDESSRIDYLVEYNVDTDLGLSILQTSLS